jgi:hypothetical protein
MISITLELISFINLSRGVSTIRLHISRGFSTIRLHIVSENAGRTVISCWLLHTPPFHVYTRQISTIPFHVRQTSTISLSCCLLYSYTPNIHDTLPRSNGHIMRLVTRTLCFPNTVFNDMRTRVHLSTYENIVTVHSSRR